MLAVCKKRILRNGRFWCDVFVRVFLLAVFVKLEKSDPFLRKIHPEELWLYKNPISPSYVPTELLWPIVIFLPLGLFFFVFLFRQSILDFTQAVLSFSLALVLNGNITTLIKLIVGRPRPDFFYRCFPDGVSNPEMVCSGDVDIITEGRKSFPSGHSSFAFTSLGFISFYIAGQLGVFNHKGRGLNLRLLTFLLPLLFALSIALSRTCDYHHHWQDVLAGSLLGLSISYSLYRQYYPPLDDASAGISYAAQTQSLPSPKSACDPSYKWVWKKNKP